MTDELKTALKEKNIIFGLKQTLKNMKKGDVKTVLLASNCSQEAKKEIEYLAKLKSVKVVKLELASDEVGMICKKQYIVSVLSY
ncbi:MAG: ribosomal L7Ae/L30e/S12e/Gadd45 family protein [archaeon]